MSNFRVEIHTNCGDYYFGKAGDESGLLLRVLADIVREMGGSFTKGRIEAVSADSVTATVETSALDAEKFKAAIQANWEDYRDPKGYYLAEIDSITVSQQ